MPEIQLYGCTNCGHVEAHAAERLLAKQKRCDRCLLGDMKAIVVQVNKTTTKFFRVDE